MKRIALLACTLACGPGTTTRVELPPAPSASAETRPTASLDELACEPHGLIAIDPDPSGALDAVRLNAALLSARDFAQRCCTGDENGDVTVRVTVSPDGYDTRVAIEPETVASGAAGACVYASFHRVVVKAFHGDPSTTSIVVRLR